MLTVSILICASPMTISASAPRIDAFGHDASLLHARARKKDRIPRRRDTAHEVLARASRDKMVAQHGVAGQMTVKRSLLPEEVLKSAMPITTSLLPQAVHDSPPATSRKRVEQSGQRIALCILQHCFPL
jgi:hypothetical protein